MLCKIILNEMLKLFHRLLQKMAKDMSQLNFICRQEMQVKSILQPSSFKQELI